MTCVLSCPVHSLPVERLGVLGGTFDPPHIGHVAAGLYTLDQLRLDRVLFVVANDPWQKSADRPVTPAADRLAMVEAAVEGHPGLEVSTVDIDRGGPSYTVDTVADLEASHPGAAIWLVLGVDAAAGMPTWHRWEDLAGRVRIALLDRPGAVRHDPPGFVVDAVHMPEIDVSSTDLRRSLVAGRPVGGLVPEAVHSVIERRGIYRRP